MQRNDKGNKPSHAAFHVKEVGEDQSYFNRIGSAFPHRDGEGLTVILDALPVDGRVTLRTIQERLEEAKTDRPRSAKTQDRDRD